MSGLIFCILSTNCSGESLTWKYHMRVRVRDHQNVVSHLVIPVANPHQARQVGRHKLLLVILYPLLRPDCLDAGQEEVVMEGEGAANLRPDQPEDREPPESVRS